MLFKSKINILIHLKHRSGRRRRRGRRCYRRIKVWYYILYTIHYILCTQV